MKPLGDFLIAHISAVLSVPSQKPQVALCCPNHGPFFGPADEDRSKRRCGWNRVECLST